MFEGLRRLAMRFVHPDADPEPGDGADESRERVGDVPLAVRRDEEGEKWGRADGGADERPVGGRIAVPVRHRTASSDSLGPCHAGSMRARGARKRQEDAQADEGGAGQPRRPSRISGNDRDRNSSSVSPVASASSSVIAPHESPRRKKFSSA